MQDGNPFGVDTGRTLPVKKGNIPHVERERESIDHVFGIDKGNIDGSRL
jgi:hypothetical protein